MLRLTQLSGFNAGGNTTPYIDQDIIYTPEITPWQTTFSTVLTTDSAGFNGYTIRQVVDASLISLSGPVMRLTMQLEMFNHIDAMYIGEQVTAGDPYDMKTSPAPAQILVGGETSFTGPPTGARENVISDPLGFAINEAKNYVITAHFATVPGHSNTILRAPLTGANMYLKAGVSEAAIADVTGYGSNNSLMYLVSKIEVITNMIGRMFAPAMQETDTFHSPNVVGGGGPQDIWWNNVFFITGYEGATGSLEVTDGSLKRRGTANIQGPFGTAPGGSVTQTRKKYGGASFAFNAATCLRWSNTGTDFHLGTAPFTIETWFWPNTSGGGVQSLISNWSGNPGNYGFMLSQNGNMMNWTVSTTGSNILVDIAAPLTSVGTAWQHVSVCFDGVTYRMHIGGVLAGSSTVLRTIYPAFSFFAIGANGDNNNYWFDGNLDDTRYTKNVARYPHDTSFTPPSTMIYAGGGGVAPSRIIDTDTFFMPFVHVPGQEAAAFLARTSGLDTAHQNAYTALINGLVDDGVWYKLDVLHIYATQNSATALLNLKSASYPGVLNGTPSPVFTTDRGFTGINGNSGSTVYIKTGFFAKNAPAGVNFIRDSAHISMWDLVNVQIGGTRQIGRMGGMGGGTATTINNRFTGDVSYFYVNAADNGAVAVSGITDGIGHWIANRSGSTAAQAYKNGNLIGSSAGPSFDVLTTTFYALGVNDINLDAYSRVCQLAMISIGGSLTVTESANFYARLRTYMTTVGVP